MGEVCDASVDDGRENPGFPPAAILCWISQPLFLGIKIQNVSRIALQQKLLSLCPSPFAKIPLIYLIFGRLTLPKYQKNITPAAMGAKRLLVLFTFLWIENLRPPEIKRITKKYSWILGKTEIPMLQVYTQTSAIFFGIRIFSGRFHRVAMNSGSRIFFEKHQPRAISEWFNVT